MNSEKNPIRSIVSSPENKKVFTYSCWNITFPQVKKKKIEYNLQLKKEMYL